MLLLLEIKTTISQTGFSHHTGSNPSYLIITHVHPKYFKNQFSVYFFENVRLLQKSYNFNRKLLWVPKTGPCKRRLGTTRSRCDLLCGGRMLRRYTEANVVLAIGHWKQAPRADASLYTVGPGPLKIY